MRRVLKLIACLFISLFVMSSCYVFAQKSIRVSTNQATVQKGQEVEIVVDLLDNDIFACTLQIYFDLSKLEYVEKTQNSNFSQNRLIYTWVDDILKDKRSSKIEKFTFKALENGMANIVVTGEFYNKIGEKIDLEDGMLQVSIGDEKKVQITTSEEELETNKHDEENVSTDNTNLKIMRLSDEGISPEFQKEIKEYYFIADSSMQSLGVTAIPENEKSRVEVIGNTNLKQGRNTIKIQVTSEDKTKQSEYKIYVTKTNNKELANANLENLAIKEGMLYPAFDNNITRYNMEVAKDIHDLTILAIPEKMNAKVSVEGGKDLKIGDNAVLVTVMAEDGITTKKYEITVHKRDEQEEAEVKEKLDEQRKQLSAILEKEESINKDGSAAEINNGENQKQMSIQDMITFILLGLIVAGFAIGFVIQKVKEK